MQLPRVCGLSGAAPHEYAGCVFEREPDVADGSYSPGPGTAPARRAPGAEGSPAMVIFGPSLIINAGL